MAMNDVLVKQHPLCCNFASIGAISVRYKNKCMLTYWSPGESLKRAVGALTSSNFSKRLRRSTTIALLRPFVIFHDLEI